MYAEFLQIALELANREAGRPRYVSRSRAVSTAYYALFHALAEFCARQLVGAWRPWKPFRHVYRSLDHATARKVFGDLRRSGEFSDDAVIAGEIFRQLQDLRHAADYDPEYRVSRNETLRLIDGARQAIGLINGLDPDERKLLAARLIERTRS